jgi:hypothetical protein
MSALLTQYQSSLWLDELQGLIPSQKGGELCASTQVKSRTTGIPVGFQPLQTGEELDPSA